MSNNFKMNNYFNNNNKNLHRYKTTNKKSISGDQKGVENVKAFWATNLYSRDDQKKIEQAEAQTKIKLGESTSGLTLDQIAQGRGHLLSDTQKNDLYVKAFELCNSIEKNKKEMGNKNKDTKIQTKNWVECQELERIKLDLENGNLTDLPDDIAVDFDALSIPSLVEGSFARYNNGGTNQLVVIKNKEGDKYVIFDYKGKKEIRDVTKNKLSIIKDSSLNSSTRMQAKTIYDQMVKIERSDIEKILSKYYESENEGNVERIFHQRITNLKKHIKIEALSAVGELLYNICVSETVLTYYSHLISSNSDLKNLDKTIFKYVFLVIFEDSYGIDRLVDKIRFYNDDRQLVDNFNIDDFIQKIENTYNRLFGFATENEFIRCMLRDHYSMIPPLKRRFIKLDDFQIKMCDFIDGKRNVILKAPTSSGKTILATLALKDYKKGLTIFIVPNDSDVLSWQTASKMEKDLGTIAHHETKNVIVVNHTFKSCSNLNDKNNPEKVRGLISRIESANVVVGTCSDICNIFPEIVKNRKEINYVIFDEVHTIDMQEGREMEHIAKMIGNLNTKSEYQIPFMALSATISNPEFLQSWFGRIGFQDVELVTCDERFFNLKLYSTYIGVSDCSDDVIPEIKDINPLSLLDYDDFRRNSEGVSHIVGKDVNFTPQDLWDLWTNMKDYLDLNDDDDTSPYSYFRDIIDANAKKMFSLKDVKSYSLFLIERLVDFANSEGKAARCKELIESFQPLEIGEHSNIDFYGFFEKLREKKMDPAIIFAINPVACIQHVRSFYKQIIEKDKEVKRELQNQTVKKDTMLKESKEEKERKKKEDKQNREQRKNKSTEDVRSGKADVVSSQMKIENDKNDRSFSKKKSSDEYKGSDVSNTIDLSKFRPGKNVGFLNFIDDRSSSSVSDPWSIFEKTIQEAATVLSNESSWAYVGSNNEPHWLIRLLTFGVGVFIKGIAEPYLRLVQHLASKKELSFVFSDKSMTFGVSMPFRTSVIVRDFFDPSNTMMNPMIYHQASGRAGRRGEDTEGNIVVVGYSWDQIKKLTVTDIPKIKGYPNNKLWETDSVSVLSGGKIDPVCLRTNFLNEKTVVGDFFERVSGTDRFFNMDGKEKYLNRLLWNFRSSYEALLLPLLIEKLLELYTTKSYNVVQNQEDVADFISRFINLNFKKYEEGHINKDTKKNEVTQVKNSYVSTKVDAKLTKDDLKKEEVIKGMYEELKKIGIILDHSNIDTRTIDSIRSGKEGVIDAKSKDSIDISNFKKIFDDYTFKVVQIQNYFYYSSDKWLDLGKEKRSENTQEIKKLTNYKALAQLLGKLTTRLWYMLRNDPTFKKNGTNFGENNMSKFSSSDFIDRSVIEGVVERDFSYNKIDNFGSNETFEEIDVAGDGNCLFRAGSVSTQGDELNHFELRSSVHDFMNTNRNYYEEFVEDNYDNYLDYIVTDGNDVGDYEVHALSNVLNRPIYVVNISTGQIRKEGDNIVADSPFESEPIVLGLYPEIRSNGDVVERGHYFWLKVKWPDDCNYSDFVENNINNLRSDSKDSSKSLDNEVNSNTLSEESQGDVTNSKTSSTSDKHTSKKSKKKKGSKRKEKRPTSSSST